MKIFELIGSFVVSIVLSFADLLKVDWVPGLIALALLLTLAALTVWAGMKSRGRRNAINWLTRLIREKSANETAFASAKPELDAEISTFVDGRKDARHRLAVAWGEYSETLVRYERPNEPMVLRNAVRPSQFFNIDDLHFGPGFWRIVPGLFVTVGLFFTFLGLIAALSSISGDGEAISDTAMANLLQIASAKFIMSLTGLLCSIIFTIVLRLQTGWVDDGIIELNRAIEHRLSFISLEDLANEQLHATREQRDHFRTIGMEMVAELGRPLREELPNTIAASISESMKPLLTQVGQMSSDGVGDMVKDLSSRFSSDVGNALGKASDRLSEAADRIGTLVERMDQSSGQMGNTMEQAIRQLAEAAVGLRSAADDIRGELETAAISGAEVARQQVVDAGAQTSGAIASAGSQVLASFERASTDINAMTEQMAQNAGQQLFAPMISMAQTMENLVQSLERSANDLQRASDGIRAGADASGQAADTFRSSSEALTAATDPIRQTTENIATSTRELGEATRTVANAALANVESVKSVLSAAEAALGGQQDAIKNTLGALSDNLDRMRGQGDRLDDMDVKLGAAFEAYTRQVEAAIDGLDKHVRSMQSSIQPALDTMREIVEQAEQFRPQSGRS